MIFAPEVPPAGREKAPFHRLKRGWVLFVSGHIHLKPLIRRAHLLTSSGIDRNITKM